MDFSSLESVKAAKFSGFKTIAELTSNPLNIPKIRGIYLVLFLGDTPKYLETGTGGFFKGKNPNVSLNMLKSNWVTNTPVIYIGKAGNVGGKATLQSRLIQYLRFGTGKSIGHWGGRYIWQLKESSDLLICWRSEISPRESEKQLLSAFQTYYSKLPFANLKS